MAMNKWDYEIAVNPVGGQEGMLLWDHFAGQAMQALIGAIATHNSKVNTAEVARAAYQFAESMMEERRRLLEGGEKK